MSIPNFKKRSKKAEGVMFDIEYPSDLKILAMLSFESFLVSPLLSELYIIIFILLIELLFSEF